MKQFAFILAILIFSLSLSCSGPKRSTSASKSGNEPELVTLTSGLKYQELALGSGKSPRAGQTVTCQMVLKTEDGIVMEDTHQTGQTLTFKIGANDVIPGLEEGVLTMKKGGKRRIIIPPELGFGNKSVRSIPANSNLICEIELIKID